MDFIEAGASLLGIDVDMIPSPRRLLQSLFLLNPSLPTPPSQSPITFQPQQFCPNPSLSCPSKLPYPIDTCCLNHPSGHFLLAQFWDTKPALGPDDAWTLHGLWPDFCGGGYDANCDASRNLNDHELTAIVDAADKSTHPGLRSYMDTYWKGLHGDADLWSHEWNKHGTCVSTLEPSCYDPSGLSPSSPAVAATAGTLQRRDLLDYITAATTLHSTLRSHAVLAAYGITPSTTHTYELADIQTALSSAHAGHIATVKCNSRHELNEIWLHYTVRGSLRNATVDFSSSGSSSSSSIFNPTAPDGLISTCPRSGIKYLPKHDNNQNPSPTWSHTTWRPVPTSTSKPKPGTPFDGRGFLKVHVLPDEDENSDIDSGMSSLSSSATALNEGCLIRQGFWYISGSCATYRAKSDSAASGGDDDEEHLFTLASSYAPCAVLEADNGRRGQGQKGEFVCANKLPVQSIFGVGVASDGDGGAVMSWKNQTVFYADKRPGRFEKIRIHGDDGDGERRVKLEIHWEST